MASARIWDRVIRNKMSSVRSPVAKVMLADQRRIYEFQPAISWNPMNAWPPGLGSGWIWPIDKLTKRHSGKGNVTLADGHVETVRPDFGEQPDHYDPLY